MPDKSTVLVTGGAGYIGSHTVLQLVARGERVVVLDDLSTGFRQAVRDVPLVEGNVGDRRLVDSLLAEHRVDTIVHFAAHTIVPESVSNPLKYYGNNTCATRSLLEAASQAGVKNFVFSSTAAVYGIPASGHASEDSPTAPINAYGTSKLMSEWMLRDLCSATPMRHVVLRYFNVAGSDPQGRIGQSTRAATLLVKAAVEAAVGKRPLPFDLRHRLPDARRHRGTRLHPRRRPGHRASELARLSARRRQVAGCERRLRPRIQRPRGAVVGGKDSWYQARRA
jgi:UDP-glucose 4-epimerase